MFYALAHDKLDTGDLRFATSCRTSRRSIAGRCKGELEVTAVSIHAYAYLLDKYALLPSGCSMGDRYGPMVVAQRPLTSPSELSDEPHRRARHADDGVPGAAAAAAAAASQHEVMPFDQILDAVAAGKFDAGLIIHEGQLTFQNQGLHLVVDLGVWWQEKTGLPLPLGGNVVRRDLGAATIGQISRLLKESIRYGLDHRAGRAELRPAVRPRHGPRSRTTSSACTSTTGRWTSATAARRPSVSSWGAPPSVATSRKASRSISSNSCAGLGRISTAASRPSGSLVVFCYGCTALRLFRICDMMWQNQGGHHVHHTINRANRGERR